MRTFAGIMMTPTDLQQVKAFAQQDGLLLCLLWTASFLFIVFVPTSTIGMLLMLATPLLMYWRLGRFRDNALEGHISFFRALLYCIQLFGAAAILFALVQLVYFQWLDHGRFFSLISNSIEQIKPLYKQQNISIDELQAALSTLKNLSAIQLVGSFLFQNLFIGIVLSPIIALTGKRK